jgi:hypothetical protein
MSATADVLALSSAEFEIGGISKGKEYSYSKMERQTCLYQTSNRRRNCFGK